MTCVYLTQCGGFTATHGHSGTLNEPPHAHQFTYQITFYGPLNDEGYLLDFRQLQTFFSQEITARFNGANLNEFFQNPTTEALAVWLFHAIQKKFPQIYQVKVAEAPDRWITYRGDN